MTLSIVERGLVRTQIVTLRGQKNGVGLPVGWGRVGCLGACWLVGGVLAGWGRVGWLGACGLVGGVWAGWGRGRFMYVVCLGILMTVYCYASYAAETKISYISVVICDYMCIYHPSLSRYYNCTVTDIRAIHVHARAQHRGSSAGDPTQLAHT